MKILNPHHILTIFLLSASFFTPIANTYSTSINAAGAAKIAEMNPTVGSQNVDLIGELGGETNTVVGQGHYVYFGRGMSLNILDTTDPFNPVFVGATPDLDGTVGALFIDGNIIYVATHSNGGPIRGSLWAIDVSNPTQPEIKGNYAHFTTGIFVRDQIAYITTDRGLATLDVHDPGNPSLITSLDIYPTGTYKTFSPFILGNYAYVAATYDGLWIVDVSNPDHLISMGLHADFGEVIEVKVTSQNGQTTGYLVTGSFVTINLNDPLHPTMLGSNYRGYSQGIFIEGNLAYVGSQYDGLSIYNIQNPANPVLVGFFDTPGNSGRVYVSQNVAYVSDYTKGLQVISVSNPAAPQKITAFENPSFASDVFVDGHTAYVAADGDLYIVNVKDAQAPWIITIYPAPDISRLVVHDKIVFAVAGESYKFLIIDVSDLSHPALLSSKTTSSFLSGIYLQGEYAYLTNNERGLHIFQVSDPVHPVDLGVYKPAGWNSTIGVAVQGNYAYVLDYTAGLRIVDVSNPAHPNEVGYLNSVMNPSAIVVKGEFAYIAAGINGFQIVDVHDPASPQKIAELAEPVGGGADDVQIIGNFAYIADYGWGFRAVNVSDPSHPQVAGFYEMGLETMGVFSRGCTIFTSDWSNGLIILGYNGPGVTCGVSGQVTTYLHQPLAGATIQSSNGTTTTTDADGLYNLLLPPGDYTVTASYPSVRFLPPVTRQVHLPQDVLGQDFQTWYELYLPKITLAQP